MIDLLLMFLLEIMTGLLIILYGQLTLLAEQLAVEREFDKIKMETLK